MNHLPLIRKNLYKKKSLHNADLFFSSRPIHTSTTELNIRLLRKGPKEKRHICPNLNLLQRALKAPQI
ncbi:hypothetical protein [Prochlorococcus marinus]|uniref:hypothetical protein n=1 Tax=Prochlorococcus marinus TaxID=1219 RepID=UPI0022B5AC08|nr:hypothetical protein [Prochlorococcus marinus]